MYAQSATVRATASQVVDACDGFLRRASIEASLTPDERREILRGMIARGLGLR